MASTTHFDLPLPPDTTYVADTALIIRQTNNATDAVLKQQETRVRTAEQKAIDAAGLVGTPAGNAVLAAISPGGIARPELNATITAGVAPVENRATQLELNKLDKDVAANVYATNESVTTEIAARVDPLVADAIANDTTVADSAAAAVEQAAQTVMATSVRRRGRADGLDLNKLVSLTNHVGPWAISAAGAALNMPDGFVSTGQYSAEANLDVIAAGPAVIQRLSSRWPAVTWERTCLDTTNFVWTEWRAASGRTSPLLELAKRDGWLALYDPTDETSITVDRTGVVYEIRDLLGNLPPLICDSPSLSQYPPYLKDEIGTMSAIGRGTLVSTFDTPIVQPLTIMGVGKDDKYVGLQRALFGGDSTVIRLQAGITSSETAYMGNSKLIRAGEPVLPGPHIWETNYDATQSTQLIDGQLVKRGLPESAVDGIVNFRIGASRRNGSSLVYPWVGKIGAIAIRAGIDHEAKNRMRQAMKAVTAIPDAKPNFAPYVRAIDLDSYGRETVIWGDPDLVTVGSVASVTKVLNAVVARKYLTGEKLTELATVLNSDEFIINPPELKGGDIVSYLDLLHAMLIPSNNTAPRTLARTLGALMPGGGDPTQKYIDAMQQQLDDWGFYGASIESNPGGGLRMSTRQMALMMKYACEDPLLKDIMGKETHTVTITGANARNVDVTNTFVSSNPYGRIDEWIASKDGTGTTTSCSVFIWRHPDGTEHIGALQGARLNVDSRSDEIAKLIEAVRSGPRLDHRFIPSGGFEQSTGPLPATWGLQ